MLDAALIEKCADPSLKPTIVEKFVAAVGTSDPLAVTVRSGDRLILVPKAKTPDEAMNTVRQYVGSAVVRVGLTQFPAGIGLTDASELKSDLVDPCENLRMGTKIFAKILRIVSDWYGRPTSAEVFPYIFDDAIYAWKTGRFEGKAVFEAPDPGGDVPKVAAGRTGIDDGKAPETHEQKSRVGQRAAGSIFSEAPAANADGSARDAPIRIDLSGLQNGAD
mgnify:CR=1 FL=1